MSAARDSTLAHLRKLAGASAVLAACACNSGYAVVDPMPPPAKCRPNGALTATGVWKRASVADAGADGGAPLVLVVTVTGFEGTPDLANPSCGSLLVASSFDATTKTATLTFAMPPGSGLSCSFALTCSAGNDQLTVSASWNTAPVEGRTEQVYAGY